MNDNLDLDKIRREAKEGWYKDRQSKRDILNNIETSVPWWLVIIAASVALLSAAHTVGVFGELSTIGYVGPFFIELGLFWAAFARVQFGKISGWLRILESVVFLLAIAANGLGAFARAASLAGVSESSLQAILLAYPTLPILTQGAILLVPLFAVAIPIATIVAGQGIAELIHRQTSRNDVIESEWKAVEVSRLYRAIFNQLIQQGVTPRRAQQKANSLAQSAVNQLQPYQPNINQNSNSGNKMTVQELVSLLEENPHWLMMTDRALAVEVGCTQYTARTAKLMFKAGEQARESNDVNR